MQEVLRSSVRGEEEEERGGRGGEGRGGAANAKCCCDSPGQMARGPHDAPSAPR